jgi:hypothetical protein
MNHPKDKGKDTCLYVIHVAFVLERAIWLAFHDHTHIILKLSNSS